MANELKRTPLFEEYSKYGGKTIDFGGWELPVQFSSIKAEHEAVRTKAGLFDVSHMGEIFVEGSESLAYLQKLVTNDVSKIAINQTQYTAMCYENGGVVDDLLTYKLAEDRYLLIVNASNIEKDFEWMKTLVSGDVKLTNASDEYGQLALQGPLAEKVLQTLTETPLQDIRPFRLEQNVTIAGYDTLISRTGYTGEDGFEIYAAPEAIIALWGKILTAGEADGVVPCGLGSRDTLRFESCLPLYGQELSKDISPLEAGINFVVKLNKEVDFVGKSTLQAQKENGVPRKSIGIEMIDKGIPRHGYPVFKGDTQIGEVTTGTQSPLTKRNIGLALIDSEYAELGQELEIEIRNRRLKVVTTATPFYKRQK
ncbi:MULTISPECIES: glycine cleavage system aminomethyltransferase GcvT [unclassified Viridibacillus]|uniref:glycine cleavage system aminomethyltransferase GcvT n=1 Tax=unclassified Viridibacillus TaxID=2617942 RepID=UPI00096CECD8|nr:glycine cleavage system aminomethyltransferase GcvT [Viridibacillus sp. FSL H8-0123]OMC85241.1 glycine cleavage system protein T [Viridibacillus sp. FSL H8-0123]